MQLTRYKIRWLLKEDFQCPIWIVLFGNLWMGFCLSSPVTQNITCLGDHYDLALPMIGDFNPNSLTMQQLCAKPAYGGHPDQSLNGWCQIRRWPPVDPAQGRVVFEALDDAQAPTLKKSRFAVGCMYRCFCSYGLADVSTQPRESRIWPTSLVQVPSSEWYQVSIDDVDDFYHVGPDQHPEDPRVNALPVWIANQIGYNLHISHVFRQPVGLDLNNYVQCRGDLPRFPLPPPYQMSDFANLQELCAVQWSGGRAGANAGAYCHRTVVPGSGSSVSEDRTVWFSDEFTPRQDWAWSGNAYLAITIRTYCWYRCACRIAPTRENLTTALFATDLFRIISGFSSTEQPDGSINLQSPGSQTSVLQVLPPQTGSNPSAGSCGSDRRQFCSMSWPTDLLGPIPQTPPNATQILSPPPGAHKLTQCGSFCQRPQDCGGGSGVGAGVQCHCAVPSPQDVRVLGLDPVAPPLVCLALLAAAKTASGLAGRDRGLFLDERGLEYRCACNETFVSESCCDSSDGLVYAA
ncbi:MAG: hypothetical protein Q9181_004415 [Wetmoreana brouardii]